VCRRESERKLVKGAHNKAHAAALSEPNSFAAAATSFSLYQPQAARAAAVAAAPDYLLIGLRALKMNGCFSAASRERGVARICAAAGQAPDFYCQRTLRFSCLDKFSIRADSRRGESVFVFGRQKTCVI
jgi:hypothetical protein